MDNNYLQYRQTGINDNPNDKIIYNNDIKVCLNECETSDECDGITISNSKCNKNITFSECISSFNDIDILNSDPENLYKYKCKFLSNIDDTNQVYFSEEKKSYIKNEYINMLNSKIDTSKYYYLKIDDKYLAISDKQDNILLVSSNSIDKASLFKFNSDGNIIELKTSKCLETNGNYIILTDCDVNLDTQKFIYENKFNSIRPFNSSQDDLILCLGLGLQSDNLGNKIELEECNYSSTQIITAQESNETNETNETDETQQYENFKSLRKQIEKKLDDVNYCSNPIYKTIVLIILVGILIYFIWFVSRKQYTDELNVSELVSTPFTKPN
jgi:hypothetical protein